MLKLTNTFSLNVYAHKIVTAHNEAQLLKLWKQALQINRPALLLGSGSNVLFLENYTGTVLLNRIKGISLREDTKAWYLHVGAGEIWHDLVTYTIHRKIPGLENLALIPGYIGSAPIQNIGAYGVELQNVCEYVDVIQLDNGSKIRLSALKCKFGYRDSVFKHQYRDNFAIVAVGLRFSKVWRPVINYGDLRLLNPYNVTSRKIFDTVCAMRRNILPNSNIGNAGSFFKNPIIDMKKATQLLACYPDVPYYPQTNGMIKIAAGWLIDRCNLKGYQLGNAAVYEKQALILINVGHASGIEIATLAKFIRYAVADKFAIWLEPEIRFIGAKGEVDAVGALL